MVTQASVPSSIECPDGKIPVSEMTVLYESGFHLIPCGGDDGKHPLRRNWSDPALKRLPLETCTKIVRKYGSATYGIRLDNLTVVDCDTDNDETTLLVSERFPSTDFKVQTSRGAHYYFRRGDVLPNSIRDGNVQIDFKGGFKHFVIGPGSIRPDGTVYQYAPGLLARLHDLPRFTDYQMRSESSDGDGEDTNEPASSNSLVPVGERNKLLCKIAVAMAREVSNPSELKQRLVAYADINCADRHTLPDLEIEKIANWAWGLRCDNRLLHGQRSTFPITRSAFGICRSVGSGATNAWWLYCSLQEAHGHQPGKVFAIAVQAMCRDGLLRCSPSTADRARKALRDLGLIERVQKGGFREPDLYRLTNSLVLGGI